MNTSEWIMALVAVSVIAYFLGSINVGILISKLKYRDDIRNHGSGNAGMTNMLRTYGVPAAVLTFLGDSAKSVLALTFALALGGRVAAYLAGFFCIVGHAFPIYFKFKGGKGVVVTATLVLLLNPYAFLILLLFFVIIVGWTKYISLGSIMCMLLYPLILNKFESGLTVIVSMVIAAFVIFLHRSNIKRLLNGNENKLSIGNKSKKKKNKDNDDTEGEK